MFPGEIRIPEPLGIPVFLTYKCDLKQPVLKKCHECLTDVTEPAFQHREYDRGIPLHQHANKLFRERQTSRGSRSMVWALKKYPRIAEKVSWKPDAEVRDGEFHGKCSSCFLEKDARYRMIFLYMRLYSEQGVRQKYSGLLIFYRANVSFYKVPSMEETICYAENMKSVGEDNCLWRPQKKRYYLC